MVNCIHPLKQYSRSRSTSGAEPIQDVLEHSSSTGVDSSEGSLDSAAEN